MNAKSFGMVVLAGIVLASNRADSAEIVRPRLVARAYQLTPIRRADWTLAARETSAILDAAGIDIDWVSCPVASTADGSGPSPCAKPLQPNEVAIRIVRTGSPTYRGQLPLGDSFVDTARHSGTLATIYLDRVEWLAHAGGVSVNILLARAIAHELGHLLLGTNTHSSHGLMRRLWTREEMIRAQAVDWKYLAADVAGMRLSFTRRLQPVAETMSAVDGSLY